MYAEVIGMISITQAIQPTYGMLIVASAVPETDPRDIVLVLPGFVVHQEIMIHISDFEPVRV